MFKRKRKGVVEEGGGITIELVLTIAAIAIIILILVTWGPKFLAWVRG